MTKLISFTLAGLVTTYSFPLFAHTLNCSNDSHSIQLNLFADVETLKTITITPELGTIRMPKMTKYNSVLVKKSLTVPSPEVDIVLRGSDETGYYILTIQKDHYSYSFKNTGGSVIPFNYQGSIECSISEL